MRKLMPYLVAFACILFCGKTVFSQSLSSTIDTSKSYLLRPYQIFDGKQVLKNTWVLVKGNEIKAVGPAGSFYFPSNTIIIDMPNQTLLPGLIDGHTHLFLHLYNEASWENQLLTESAASRAIGA